ncbi:unnamed protein product [Lampetra fluviatilis]
MALLLDAAEFVNSEFHPSQEGGGVTGEASCAERSSGLLSHGPKQREISCAAIRFHNFPQPCRRVNPGTSLNLQQKRGGCGGRQQPRTLRIFVRAACR